MQPDALNETWVSCKDILPHRIIVQEVRDNGIVSMRLFSDRQCLEGPLGLQTRNVIPSGQSSKSWH